MATAWNLKKVHNILNTKIKLDVNNIYNDLAGINTAVEALAATDTAASAKNGESISNFSGHKARQYFNVLKKASGYYANSEKFYKSVYKLCSTMVDRGQQRAIKDNNAKYKSYTKWAVTLPTNKAYAFNHTMPATVSEEFANVSKNIYTLKDNVDKCYNSYIAHMQNLATDLKELKKYVPDGLDKKIATISKKIDNRITATKNRKNQLTSYVNDVVLQFLLANMDDETAMSSSAGEFDEGTTQVIDQ